MKHLNEEKEIHLIKADTNELGFQAMLIRKNNEFAVSGTRSVLSEVFYKHKKIERLTAKWSDAEFIMEGVFTTNISLDRFEAQVSVIKSKEFSERKKLFHRLIIPVKKKISFFSIIQDTTFETPESHSRGCLRANFKSYNLDIFSYTSKEKTNFLVLDCSTKIGHSLFSEAAFACLVTLGYLTGKLVQNEGVYFTYSKQEMDTPISLMFSSFRPSINSLYYPVNANPYSFKLKGKKAESLHKKMKPLSEIEFSKLCQQVYNKHDLRASLLLLMEVLKGSIFTMATGMAVILESLTNQYAKENPEYFIYVKPQKISSAILQDLRSVIIKHGDEIGESAKHFINRINQLNQVSNKTRLTKPFELLGFNLNIDDVRMIERRNDLLHGRLSLNFDNDIEKADNELYLIATKLYTLINILILKQIGFSGYIINWPVFSEQVHKQKLNEDLFRKI